MSTGENPFVGMTKAQDDVVERLLSDIYRDGEWDDTHEDLLAQWRAARGDDAFDHWVWWVGYVGSESYAEDAENRMKAIDRGRRDYSDDGGKFQIIEACVWNDNVKDGDEVTEFARTRNHQIISASEGEAA